MHLFLTSEIGATAHENGRRVAGDIDNRYGFLTHFRSLLCRYRQMLYISSTPDPSEKVSDWFQNTVGALQKANISFGSAIFVNGVNARFLKDLLPGTDVVFLSGGHLPTQNSFFRDIGLRDLLKSFDGIIVAQSAGSMNCAETVYVCPEVPGESTDSAFQRFRPGLGLTDISIIPHYNDNHNFVLDGKRFYEDIIAPDTYKKPLYVLTDGSYIYSRGCETHFHGEIYVYAQGEMRPVPGAN